MTLKWAAPYTFEHSMGSVTGLSTPDPVVFQTRQFFVPPSTMGRAVLGPMPCVPPMAHPIGCPMG